MNHALKTSRPAVWIPLFALTIALLAFNGLGGLWLREGNHTINALPHPAAAALPAGEAAQMSALRALSARVQRDPDDFRAQNLLAGRYLQRLHETSDSQYLTLALHAAHASLNAVGAEANAGGLTVTVMAEQSSHNFNAAREGAQRLVKMQPSKSNSHALLGDALLELGDYAGAAQAFARMETIGGGSGVQTRLARLDLLRGQPAKAAQRFSTALALALDAPVPQRETVAWCRWQLGETAFSVGDLANAETWYQEALTTYPDYFRALASLARVRAAQGDVQGGIALYEKSRPQSRRCPGTAQLRHRPYGRRRRRLASRGGTGAQRAHHHP